MATELGWFGTWFADGYFPPVWFSPSDESHLVDEEIRPEYRGGTGRMLPAKDPFADASDDDIRRLVEEKWEAIEQANERDRVRQEPAGKDSGIGEQPDHDAASNAVQREERIDASPVPSAPVVADPDPGLTIEASKAARAQEQRNQEAIAILLLEAS